MKRMAYTVGVLFVVLAVVFAVGPRPSVDVTRRPGPLPDDVEAYLARSEAEVPDLQPGVAKQIAWADPATKARTEVAVVYLHGFSATREETRPLCDTVAARLGANLFYTRLAGHGRGADAMGAVDASDWIRDAYEALAVGRRLGNRVVMVGTSTGATLAAWLAAQPDAGDLLALVLISPNFTPRDAGARVLLWPWGETIARWVVGSYREWEPRNAQQARYWTTRYPVRALVSMMSLVDLVAETDLDRIDTPVLVFYAPQDAVVDAALIKARFPDFGASRKRLVSVDSAGDPSNHVLAGSILSPGNTEPMAQQIVDFVRSVYGF